MQKIKDEKSLEEIIIDLRKRIEFLEKGNNFSVLPNESSDPSNAQNGQKYYNTSTNKMKVYENGTWKTVTTT